MPEDLCRQCVNAENAKAENKMQEIKKQKNKDA